MKQLYQRGMTLIEILTVLAIIAILAVFVVTSLTDSTAQSRDAERQSDLRMMQNAVELYRQEYGRYPEGCNGADNWSGETGGAYECASGNQYIVGLAPKFIRTLPKDPKRIDDESGYAYKVNADGSVYKIVVFKSVEQLRVTDDAGNVLQTMAPLFLCDVNGAVIAGNDDQATCLVTHVSINPWGGNSPPFCNPKNNTEGYKFRDSYAVWGGYALQGNTAQQEGRTESIICDAPPTT